MILTSRVRSCLVEAASKTVSSSNPLVNSPSILRTRSKLQSLGILFGQSVLTYDLHLADMNFRPTVEKMNASTFTHSRIFKEVRIII